MYPVLDDLPVIIEKKDADGRFHSDDGPAWVFEDGEKLWFDHGKLFQRQDRYGNMYYLYETSEYTYHNTDGPAVIYINGRKEWWLQGKRHRLDGPAIIDPEKNIEEWWLFGKSASPREVKEIMERHHLPEDWSKWSEDEVILFRLAI